ncbi:hypothetical protein PORY_000819 [Pneumocystis oryctolagi]|uniref:Uncharacterized protein n=1 Tax=Pneumocystis oryctolagi TaxID=42067 RepID=A0ACB7CG42_9ASCO|nr:hypothetical protein PORY_000819 [Pneumocystis oryctolagi]
MDFLFKGYNFFPQPKQQIAEETIIKLCDRLEHATLLEDRRAAVLGLKGFSREYPEAVVVGSLKGLIQSLLRDKHDSDILRITLETIVILFSNHNSDDSNDTSLWLADEFVLKNENFEVLLDILKETDFYIRLYSIQIMLFIVKYRLTQVQESMFLSSIGVSRIISLLDDKRDAIRNGTVSFLCAYFYLIFFVIEAILLLISIFNDNVELQKKAVFESVFDRVLTVMHFEGGLLSGSLVVFDCLVVLQNLVRYNSSNQNWFREMGLFGKVKDFLSDLLDTKGDEIHWKKQKLTNIISILEFIRLFVPKETLGNTLNQSAIFKEGVFSEVIKLSFLSYMPSMIRAEAIKTCGYLIKGNLDNQKFFLESFLSLNDIPSSVDSEYIVVQHLFSIALSSSESSFFLRLSSCYCFQSYISSDPSKRIDILIYVIDMFKKNDSFDSFSCNPLAFILMFNEVQKPGPCEIWFSCIILMHIIEENLEAKRLIREIVIGDLSLGEEPVSCIQIISANLISSLGYPSEYRASVAYLMLLIFWLFEDNQSISEFFSEGSVVQYLFSVLQNSKIGIVLQGLVATLLAIAYHFTDELSPMPRESLKLFIDRIGRDSFVNRIIQFKEHLQLKDCISLSDKGNMDDIYIDETFIDFFKDNYGIIRKAVDRGPHLSLQIRKINVECEELFKKNVFLVESLEKKKCELQILQKEKDEYIQEQHIKVKNIMGDLEIEKQSAENMKKEFIQKNTDLDFSLKKSQNELEKLSLRNEELFLSLKSAEEQLVNVIELKKKDTEKFNITLNEFKKDAEHYHEIFSEVLDLRSLRDSLQSQLSQEKASMESCRNSLLQLKNQESKLMNEILELKNQKNELEKRIKDVDESWLLVVEELEKKRKRDKCRLKELGDTVSETDDEND